MNKKQTELIDFDRKHIWHPYTSMSQPLPSYLVESAKGVNITLATGENLIDGMSSWWSVLHGYNHPKLNEALIKQTEKMAHVMFGGLTHEPAINLCEKLIEMTPEPLEHIFLSDSGSVAVEVAMKMAIQYWQSLGQKQKHKLLTVRNGYHGDTFAAMSVCDPVNGMHQIFESVLMQNIFAPAPTSSFHGQWNEQELNSLKKLFKENHHTIAAFIIEPIVQGTGGMNFYHPEYLKACRQLCDQYNVLFIADEIATGLGRTGKLFACQWADISPDIMCLGKTLTGGYMTLAATLCTKEIANTISEGDAGCFMHGPTFMANPLACAVANASLEILQTNEWQQQIASIETYLINYLMPLNEHHAVSNARVLGGIGVVETKEAVNMAYIQKRFVELGVWIRPFGKLIYIMPPFISQESDLAQLVNAIKAVLDEPECFL
jgi:adenosylmethionine-8-amino-7-oxononanoate aminotransferase